MSMPVRYKFLGVEITPLTMDELQEVIAQAVGEAQRWVVANHNLHSVCLTQRDSKLRKFYARAKLAHIDGMLLVFFARIKGYSVNRQHRVTYIDWVRPLMAEAEKEGWRVFFLGSSPGVGDTAATELRRGFPQLKIEVHHGYFDMQSGSEDNNQVIGIINAYRPNILMVGMGMPRQEHWIFENYEQLDTNVILPAGACMD